MAQPTQAAHSLSNLPFKRDATSYPFEIIPCRSVSEYLSLKVDVLEKYVNGRFARYITTGTS